MKVADVMFMAAGCQVVDVMFMAAGAMEGSVMYMVALGARPVNHA
jgi:hypothetical protein